LELQRSAPFLTRTEYFIPRHRWRCRNEVSRINFLSNTISFTVRSSMLWRHIVSLITTSFFGRTCYLRLQGIRWR